MMRGMDKDVCPYQSVLRHKYEETGDWQKLNEKYQERLFPEISEKFGADEESLNFTSVYPYIDNYYSAYFDQMEIPNDISPEAKKDVDDVLRDGLYEGISIIYFLFY